MILAEEKSAEEIPQDAWRLDQATMNEIKCSPLVNVTYQKGKGFKKCIGKYADADGTVRDRIWWFGHQELLAQRLATVVYYYHRRIVKGAHWTPGTIQTVKTVLDTLKEAHDRAVDVWQNYLGDLTAAKPAQPVPKSTPAPLPVPPTQPEVASDKTLKAQVREYTDLLKLKVPHQLSKSNYSVTVRALDMMCEVLDGNKPMKAIGNKELGELVAYFTSRPKRKKKKPMSVDSITTFLSRQKRFFEWADGNGWDGPKKWEKAFRIRRNALYTLAEQMALVNGQDTHTLDDLKLLYAKANSRQRLYILLGLNCAFTQVDIATLLQLHIRRDTEGVPQYIDRVRKKPSADTLIRGRWELWPETASLLEKEMKATSHNPAVNPDLLALMTEKDLPLVRDATRSDAIAQSWGELLKAVNKEKQVVRPLSFKYLRKTAGNAIRRIANEDVQQMMLSHARETVADKHYTGELEFELLDQALRKYRETLIQAGVLTPQKAKSR